MIVDFRKSKQSAIIEVHVMTLHYFPFFLSHPKGIWPINEKRIWFILFLVATDISLCNCIQLMNSKDKEE